MKRQRSFKTTQTADAKRPRTTEIVPWLELPVELWSHEIVKRQLANSPMAWIMLRRTCHWMRAHLTPAVDNVFSNDLEDELLALLDTSTPDTLPAVIVELLTWLPPSMAPGSYKMTHSMVYMGTHLLERGQLARFDALRMFMDADKRRGCRKWFFAALEHDVKHHTAHCMSHVLEQRLQCNSHDCLESSANHLGELMFIAGGGFPSRRDTPLIPMPLYEWIMTRGLELWHQRVPSLALRRKQTKRLLNDFDFKQLVVELFDWCTRDNVAARHAALLFWNGIGREFTSVCAYDLSLRRPTMSYQVSQIERVANAAPVPS